MVSCSSFHKQEGSSSVQSTSKLVAHWPKRSDNVCVDDSNIRKSEQKMKNEFCWTQPKLFSLNWCKYITVFSQEPSVVDVKWQVLTYLVGHE